MTMLGFPGGGQSSYRPWRAAAFISCVQEAAGNRASGGAPPRCLSSRGRRRRIGTRAGSVDWLTWASVWWAVVRLPPSIFFFLFHSFYTYFLSNSICYFVLQEICTWESLQNTTNALLVQCIVLEGLIFALAHIVVCM
jgi:hypothetical protein